MSIKLTLVLDYKTNAAQNPKQQSYEGITDVIYLC